MDEVALSPSPAWRRLRRRRGERGAAAMNIDLINEDYEDVIEMLDDATCDMSDEEKAVFLARLGVEIDARIEELSDDVDEEE
jgi:hypothetical protein